MMKLIFILYYYGFLFYVVGVVFVALGWLVARLDLGKGTA